MFPLTDTLSLNFAMPPTQTDVATSRRPLTDTSFLKSVLEVNVPAPAAANVPPTDTLFLSIAAFSTVTVDLNVAAPTAVTVL